MGSSARNPRLRTVASRYRILEVLGQGGTGTVYRALDTLERREVALKVLHGDSREPSTSAPRNASRGPEPLTTSSTAAEGLEGEFRVLASLSHPHLAEVYNFGVTSEGLRYFTMELIRGEDLKSFARRRRAAGVAPADDPLCREVLVQVLAALDYIHTRKVIHEDLKPSNILVVSSAGQGDGRPDGKAVRVKLIDFGLARSIERSRLELSGTVEYMAPEKARGGAGDVRSDLYSLGVVLFELFTGEPPFRGQKPLEVILAHREEPVPAGEMARIPEPFRSVAARLLEKSPGKRIQTAHEVLSALFGPESRAAALLPAFTAFVGREPLLSRLLGRLDRARAGQGTAVLLKGESGLGKSRLLRELQVRLQLQTARVVSVSAGGEGRRPGEAIARILRALRSEIVPDSPQAKPPGAAVLEMAFDGLAAAGAGTGPPPEGGPAHPRPAPLGDEAAKERLFHQAGEFLLGLSASRPLVILIDDLQWADTLDLQFLLHLQRKMRGDEPAGLLLVLAARSETDDDRRVIAEIEGPAQSFTAFESIDLPGLTEEEVRGYLAQVLGSPDSFPEELPPALARDTGGNPFFLEEVLKLVCERGGIVREGARWRVLPGVALETPGGLQEVIRDRLSRLGPFPREVLAWAAILDEPFTRDELLFYLQGGQPSSGTALRERLDAALGELVLAQLLSRDRTRYALVHRRVGSVVYGEVADEERRRRHRRIGERILAEGELWAERRLERVAHHLFLSDRPELAREHLILAGARAQRSGALREAGRYLSRALQVARQGAERYRVLLQREQVWGLLADRRRQLEDLEELARLSPSLDDPSLAAEGIVREAVYLDATGKKRESLARYEEAMSLVERAGDRRAQARVLSRRAMAAVMLGEFESGLAQLETALEIARAEGDRPQEAETSQMLGVARYFQGNYEAALAQMAQALVIRRELGEEHRVGALESNIGLIHFDRGDFEAAEERFKKSLRISRSIGFRRGEAVNLVNLGLTYSEMGRYERALDFIGEALRIRRELGDRWGEGADLGNLGTVYLRLGRLEAAVPLLEDAVALARQFGNRASEGNNECKLGMVELLRGERDRAEARFQRGLEIGSALRLFSLEVLAASQLARASLEKREPARALQLLEGPLRKALAAKMQSSMIECLSLKAAALLDLGRREEALEASGEAVACLGRFRGWLERSHEVHYIHARVLASAKGEGPEGERGLEAKEALRSAHAHLLEKAEAIRDQDLRAAFLQNLPLHREIVQAFQAEQEAVRREASRRERSFYEISRIINSIVDLEPLLDRLLDLAVETTRAQKGMILLRDLAGRLTLKAARDMAQESIADAAEICRSVISDVSRRGEPILAADAAADERFRERKSVIDFHIRSLMCVPLTVRGELIGAVYVDSQGETAFSQDDLLYLGSFAHLAAIAIENARLLARLREENLYLRREVETRYRFENLIGASAAMRAVFATMEKVARTPASVLIAGETGTGKELIARAIHYHGPRKDRPFVAVDCGALPENLLESELFGHKRGAFSGALHDRVGLFEEAEGGTIFLDEVTNTSPDLQAKLLRVLQEGEIRRVGENQYRKVDVRVIAATNLEIEKEVGERRFRQDLYYRLNVVPIRVPPLRERREDIPLLAAHFLERCAGKLGRKVAGFTEEAMALLVQSDWRGNVRELEHVIEKAVILGDRDRIGVEAISELREPPAARLASGGAGAGAAGAVEGALARSGALGEGASEGAGMSLSLPFDFASLSLEEFDQRWLETESAYLRFLVEKAQGNFSRAARLAQVKNRNTLIARLKRHGISR